jgi:ribosomal protein L7/L12
MELWLLFFVVILLFSVNSIYNRVKSTEAKIDRIAKKLGVSHSPLDEELRALLKAGKDVEAVKVARDELGLSLVEGKKYVDSLRDEAE